MERPRLDNKLYIRLRGGTYREASPEEVMTGGWVKDPTYRRSAIIPEAELRETHGTRPCGLCPKSYIRCYCPENDFHASLDMD